MIGLLIFALLASLGFAKEPPIIFSNPAPGTTPIWTAQSKQTLIWRAEPRTYRIYAIQDDVQAGLDVLKYMIISTVNGSGYNALYWTVDIPPETTALSPAFHFAFLESGTDDAALYTCGYFNVSDLAVVQISTASTQSTASTSTTGGSFFSFSTINWSTRTQSSKSAATTAPATLTSWAAKTTASTASSSATLTLVSASAAMSSASSAMDPPTNTHTRTSVEATVHDTDIATATDQAGAGVQHARENDTGIWIGVGSGLGLPLVALGAAAVLRNTGLWPRWQIVLNE